jgi:hypothetical protein
LEGSTPGSTPHPLLSSYIDSLLPKVLKAMKGLAKAFPKPAKASETKDDRAQRLDPHRVQFYNDVAKHCEYM